LQVVGNARWPMYIRNVKQLVRSVDPTFDERKYGFSGFNELLRACAKDGLLRLERGRQGVLRVLPGAALQAAQAAAAAPAVEAEPAAETQAAPAEPVEQAAATPDEAPSADVAPEAESEAPKKRRRTRAASSKKTAAGTRKTATRKPRAKKAAPPDAE